MLAGLKRASLSRRGYRTQRDMHRTCLAACTTTLAEILYHDKVRAQQHVARI
jgi:hypothetical protein